MRKKKKAGMTMPGEHTERIRKREIRNVLGPERFHMPGEGWKILL